MCPSSVWLKHFLSVEILSSKFGIVNYNWRNLDFLDMITALLCKTHPYGWFPQFQRQYFILNNPFSLKIALLWQMSSSVKSNGLSVSLIKKWKPC